MFIKTLCATLAIIVVMEATILSLEIHHGPQPYKFGYSVMDEYGEQHPQEFRDDHSGVKGSYGFNDYRGLHRQVNYIANHAGFGPQEETNEPGTANQDPAAVNVISFAHPYYGAGYGFGGVELRGAGYGFGSAGLRGPGYGLGATGLLGTGYDLDDVQGEIEIGDLGVRRSLRLGHDLGPGYDNIYGLY